MFTTLQFNGLINTSRKPIQPQTAPSQKQTMQMQSGDSFKFSGNSSKAESSKSTSSELATEDWKNIKDPVERRKVQNRIAQRNYRQRLKSKLQQLENLEQESEGSTNGNAFLMAAPSTKQGEELNSEEWKQVDDPLERKRIQNKLAQRNYRRRQKEKLQQLEQLEQQKANSAQYDSDMDADHESVTEEEWNNMGYADPGIPAPTVNDNAFMAFPGFPPQHSFSVPKNQISHKAMLMHFVQQKQLDPTASPDDHFNLIDAMLTFNAKPELVVDYLNAVQQHYGVPN